MRTALLPLVATGITTANLLQGASHARDLPHPVEYVLQGDGCVARSELITPFEENVEVRGAGDRSDRWITGVRRASVTLYAPTGKPSATAVICPGGGYGGLSFDKEGAFIARWLRERGMAAAVLKYTVAAPGGGPLWDRPLRDAQRAIRLLQRRVGGKVGVIGFSAGGHLAAMAANRHGGTDSPDGGVAFQALIYPVITMERGVTHGGSRENLLGESPAAERVRDMSAELTITANTPPAFLVHTADDQTVPVENSLRYVRACGRHGAPAELHVYPTGGHGYGMWTGEETVASWPQALERWLRANALLR